MWGDRTGREPVNARSPLAMRRVASLIGVALSLFALALLVVTGQDNIWAYAIIAALAVGGLADAYVIGRHMHSGQRHHQT
jgi:hypothetical protein